MYFTFMDKSHVVVYWSKLNHTFTTFKIMIYHKVIQ